MSGLGDRGAVLLEAAIAIPLLLLLMFGTLEAGMAWGSKTAATSGVRTGILRAASLGGEPETDLRVLQSIVGELGPDRVPDVNWVVIFDADPSSGADPDSIVNDCAASFDGVAGLCNRYSAAQLTDVMNGSITVADFDDGSNATTSGDYNCETVAVIDTNWCAGSRVTVNQPTTNVGLAISYRHDWVTGVLPGESVTFSDYAISSTLLGEQAEDPVSAPVPPIPSASGGGGGPAASGGPYPWSSDPADLVNVYDMAAAPSTTAADGAMSSDSQAYAFLETPSSGVVLGADLTVNATVGGTYDDTVPPGSDIIPAGTVVCSMMIQGDRVTTPGSLSGSMVLAGGVQILGIIYTDTALDASDGEVGNPGTNYDDTGGTDESDDSITFDNSGDPNTISWNMNLDGGHIDQIRVITTC